MRNLLRAALVASSVVGVAGFVFLIDEHAGAQGTAAKAEPAAKPAVTATAQPAAGVVPAPTASAAPDPADVARRAEVVASFDGGKITVGDLEDAITAQSPFMQQRFVDRAAVKELLDKSLRFELLAQEAERRGLGNSEPVMFAVKQNAVQTMLKQDIDDKITTASVPTEDVKKYYDEHIDEFVRPEMRRASQVLVKNEAEAKSLVKEAKAADMRAFRELSRNHSLDETTKQRGGDLRYFDIKGRVLDEGVTTIDAALAKTVFTLKAVGDTTDVVAVDGGFAIAKMTGQRPAHEETIKEADDRIRMRLWRDKRQAAIDGMLTALKAELKPEVHPELIDAIRFEGGAAVPPGEGLPAGFPQKQPTAAPPDKK